MKSRLYLLTALLTLAVSVSCAQQLPQHTQFMNNRLLYNPAYAGISGGFNAVAMGRWQWAGFDGAPNTQSLAVDGNVPAKQFGWGLSVSRDAVAVTSSTNLAAAYAYHIVMGKGKLSMGISANMNRLQVNYNDVYVPDPDVNFNQQASSSRFNFGTGLYYDHDTFWLSASLPGILNNGFKENGEVFYHQSRHFFLAGGYRYHAGPRVRLEPNIMVATVQGASPDINLNLMTWIDARVGGGLGYRTDQSLQLIIQLKIAEGLHAGYAFDYVLNNDKAGALSRTSHEVMIAFRTPWQKKA